MCTPNAILGILSYAKFLTEWTKDRYLKLLVLMQCNCFFRLCFIDEEMCAMPKPNRRVYTVYCVLWWKRLVQLFSLLFIFVGCCAK